MAKGGAVLPPDRSRLTSFTRPIFWGVVTCLALILLLLQADTRGIWQDEGLTLYQIRLPYAGILANQIPVAHVMTPNTVPPFFFLVLATWGRLFGFDLWTLRLFSILCTLVVLFLLYQVGKRVADARVGRIAALLTAVSPVMWWYAQELRMYAFLLLPATLSFGLLWRWYHGCGDSRLNALAYTITVAVMVWTHYIAFYLVAAQVLWIALVLYPRYPRVVLAIAATVAAAALPLIPFALERLGTGAERDFFFLPLPVIAGDVVQSFAFGTPQFVSRWDEIWWLLPLAWGLLGLGVWQAKRTGGWPLAVLLGLGIGLPVAAIAALGYIKPLYQNVRHAYVVAPAFYLLCALGLVRLSELRRWAAVVVVVLLGYGWSLSTIHYFAPDRPLKNDVRPLFETLARRYAPGDLIVLNDPVLQHSLEYFAPDANWEILPPYGDPDPAHREAVYAQVAASVERIWVIWGPPDTGHDTWRELRDYYRDHHGQLDYLEFPGQTLIGGGLFDTRGELFTLAPLPVAITDTADFGDGIRFLGLARPLIPTDTWQAGERLVVQTIWQAETMPGVDYQLVARLVDGAGQVWGQHQSHPYAGLHLTSHWQPGQYLRIPVFLDFPATLPPATYFVTLHWVAPDGSPRYPVGTAQPKMVQGNVPLRRPLDPPAGRGAWLTDHLQVEAVALPATLPPVPTVPLTLRLHVAEASSLPTAFRVALRSTSGETLWTQDLDPARGAPLRADGTSEFPPAVWQSGDTFDLRYLLTLPPTAEGRFSLHITALDGESPLPAPSWGGWLRTDSVELGQFMITPRQRTFEVPPVGVSVDRTWPDAVRLVGYTGEPAEFRSDAPFELRLVWQAVAPTDRPYKVFLHLVDANGNFVTGADGFLEVPSNAWAPDEVTGSRHRFEAGSVPPGDYGVIVGLYDEATGERLPVEAPDFAVPLGQVTVR